MITVDMQEVTEDVPEYQAVKDLLGWINLPERHKGMLLLQIDAAIKSIVEKYHKENVPTVIVTNSHFSGYNSDGGPLMVFNQKGKLKELRMDGWYCEGPRRAYGQDIWKII